MASKQQDKEDLDTFLTVLEAKMRGPYSSLDLAKIVATHSLRGQLSPQEYLHNVSQVLARTDKMTQLRSLVGLLGLEPGTDTDTEVYDILTQAQESPLHEEWVRVIAGLARGILFVDGADEDGTGESCRGEEASDLLDRTCKDIVEQTRQLEKETEAVSDQPSLQTSDMYPLFVSYRYSLLNPELLDRVIPEHKSNPHFQFDRSANILSMDDKLEKAKVIEAQASKPLGKPAAVPGSQAKSAAEAAKAVLPGSKTTKKVAPKGPARSKTSMFMPTKKRPGIAAGRGGGARQVVPKGGLHTRKAGAAQSLLSKNRRPGMNAMGGTGVGAAASGTVNRAQKLANMKSKMKMIDVTEVQGLNKEHKQRESKIAKAESKESKLSARKRKILEAAAEKGLVALPKIQKLDGAKPGKDKQVTKKPQPAAVETAPGEEPPGNTAGVDDNSSNQEWQNILKERSNKLSMEDRSRVQQFFADKFNPTPDQPVYKMKLHEERITDPETGQAMKHTYYLELDYATFTSKQSKKTKRY